MLSICIPVFEYDARNLVGTLWQQAQQLGMEVEVLVLEDGSRPGTVRSYENARHEVLVQNIGRAAARNRLAQMAKFDWLLFIDADSGICQSDYLSTYIEKAKQGTLVCCGGTVYAPTAPPAESLRFAYGKAREERAATKRGKGGFRPFTANNFLIKKSVFEKTKFNEALAKYGHEDTLFGLELQGQGIGIHHIHNPVQHLGLETNDVFLAKTEESIGNLVHILEGKLATNERALVEQVRLLNTAERMKAWHIAPAYKRAFGMLQGLLKSHLSNSARPSMLLFDLYKLGIYLQKSQR
jgi:glycosyltransferase involved in cell wall biosynthesis